jgi:hypothetical protein
MNWSVLLSKARPRRAKPLVAVTEREIAAIPTTMSLHFSHSIRIHALENPHTFQLQAETLTAADSGKA